MTYQMKFALAAFVAGLLTVAFVGGTMLLTDSLFIRSASLLADIALCYLIWQFSDLKATSEASDRAWRHAKLLLGPVPELFGQWLRKPHPFAIPLYTLLVLFVGRSIYVELADGFIVMGNRYTVAEFGIRAYLSRIALAVILLSAFTAAICGALTAISALGASWRGYKWSLDWGTTSNQLVKQTYSLMYWSLLMGFGAIIWFAFWGFWKFALTFIGVFCWELLKLVHSNERLMISIDGPLGGLASIGCYWLVNWAFGAAGSPLEYGLVALFGGIFASAFALINLRYVAPLVGYDYLSDKAII